MKIPKLTLVIGSIVLALAIILGFHFYMRAKISVAVSEEKVKTAQVEIALIKTQLQESHAINDEIETALENSRQASAAQQAVFLAAIAKLKIAQPAELVSAGGQAIGATDIVLSTDQKTVSMGIETYRKFVIAVAERDDYKLVREPAWISREILYQKDIGQYKTNEILYDRRDALNSNIINDLRSVISKQKTTSFFGKLAWGAVGAGLGMLTQKLLK